MQEKNWTGERLETFVLNENTIEHLHRYAIAIQFSDNKVVLDIASGEGYGSNLIAEVAKKVIGVDISKETIIEAEKKYKKKNIEFKVGSATEIPVQNSSVDVVVSFETIEHHDQHIEMLLEIKRVLKPDGILIMSSPDKKFYSDLTGYKNPFHIKELYFDEFKSLIKNSFANTQFYFQNMFRGSVIVPENLSKDFNSYNGDYDAIQKDKGFFPLYNICIASDIPIYEINLSMFSSTNMETENKIKEMQNLRLDVINQVRNSWSYKIGNLIMKPLRLFKWRR